MNVWIMNLKDNREEATADGTAKKFAFCKEKGIVGIGWASDSSKEEEKKAYENAKSAIEDFKIDDLVWVRNSTAKEGEPNRYICKITAMAVTTNDTEFNNSDISQFCCAEFYPIENIPDGISDQELVSRRTISKANENVSTITEQYMDSLMDNSPLKKMENPLIAERKNKKQNIKKIMLPAVIVLVAVLAIFSGLKIYKLINMKTHPVLPSGIKMGMSFNKFNESGFHTLNDSLEEKDFIKYDKNYFCLIYLEESNSIRSFCNKIFDDNVSLEDCTGSASFNENKNLYNLFFSYSEDNNDLSRKIYDLAKYYSKATGKKISVKDSLEDGINYKNIAFDFDDIEYNFTWYSFVVDNGSRDVIQVSVESKKIAPYIPEISSETINSAFNRVNYNIGGFYKINLRQLINACVTNQEIEYNNYRKVRLDLDSEITKSIESGEYADYLATSYVITVHGDVCSNPDIKYLITEDIDAIKILMYFDDSGDYKGYAVLEKSNDFNTFAILYASQSSSYYY